ncbi:hypothetical protein N7493_006670 [Penicillium malachiteum]|uniref:Uncharacterized protein n=1 Tax=Penicillium malachiteum TaxID=1324776 RepID=A0AAD6HL16_9EURO|nr:hypothetical protein N7493_006670 [Penicillium malachiteum]
MISFIFMESIVITNSSCFVFSDTTTSTVVTSFSSRMMLKYSLLSMTVFLFKCLLEETLCVHASLEVPGPHQPLRLAYVHLGVQQQVQDRVGELERNRAVIADCVYLRVSNHDRVPPQVAEDGHVTPPPHYRDVVRVREPMHGHHPDHLLAGIRAWTRLHEHILVRAHLPEHTLRLDRLHAHGRVEVHVHVPLHARQHHRGRLVVRDHGHVRVRVVAHGLPQTRIPLHALEEGHVRPRAYIHLHRHPRVIIRDHHQVHEFIPLHVRADSLEDVGDRSCVRERGVARQYNRALAYRKMQHHYEILHLEHFDETLTTPIYVANQITYDDWLRHRRPIDKCAKLDDMSLYQVRNKT